MLNWLKRLLARRELEELEITKRRIDDLQTWCGCYSPDIDASTKWLKNIHDYPCQFRGPYGSIADFREYIKKRARRAGDE